MMKNVFVDSQKQQEYEVNGYVTFPCLSDAEVEKVQAEYEKLDHTQADGFHCSMFHPEKDYRQKINTLVKSSLGNKLDDILVDYEKLFGNFVVKEPGAESDLYVHQDWNFVDESEHDSLAIWIPLVDTSLENGALFLVPGSHKLGNKVRGPGVPDPFSELHDVIRKKYGKMIPLKAGEAIIWNHRMVHYSPANTTSVTRVALTCILVPNKAKVFHNWGQIVDSKPNTEIENFTVNEEFYMFHNVQERPATAHSNGMIDCTFPIVTEKQLKTAVQSATGTSKGFLNRIKALLTAT